MAITLADFDKIWASTSPLTPYSFSEANYKRGWNFIGATPPARQMWDSYMKASDEKHQWLYNNKLSLSGGTMTGGITLTANNFVKRSNDAGHLRLMGGTELANGASLTLLGIDHSAQPGQFMLRARDASTYKDLLGKPDGSLTWAGKSVFHGTITTTATNGGYEINSVANFVTMWTRINMAQGATTTWTFPVAMANTYYCRYACNEDGNSVALSNNTTTSITVKNNSTKNWDNVCILIIGTPAS